MSLPALVTPVAALSDAERARTARHASLVGFGELGQRHLAAAHVAVMGAGGLGSPVVLALAAAGVGTLTIIDDDVVEASNLQRQVMHRHADIGAPKVDSVVRVAGDLAPEVRVRTITEHLTPENAARLLAGADLVLDGSDTFDTREAVAAACEQLGVPLVWGTIQEFHGQVTVFWSAPPPGHDAVVLADLYPPGSMGEVPTCAQVGVLGAMCLQVGALMATEAIKLIAGIGDPLLGRVLVVDALGARHREVPLRGTGAPRAQAPARAQTPVAAPAPPPRAPGIRPRELADALANAPAPALLDVREADEVVHGMIPGARHVPLAEVLADPASTAALVNDGGSRETADAPLVVVCAAGARAQRAADALLAVGVDARVLAGGMQAWQPIAAARA